MQIDVKEPVVVGVPLDATTADVVAAASALAAKLGTSLVPVHTLRPWPFPTARRTPEEAAEARTKIVEQLAPHAGVGLSVAEPVIVEGDPTAEILDVARRTRAQLVVVGQGTGPTVGRWLLGSIADRVVRAARCPVLVARGTLPGPAAPVVCAVDLSPHSRLGFLAGLRMARLFGAPLRVVTVLPPPRSQSVEALAVEAAGLEQTTRAELDALTKSADVAGVALELRVLGGDPVAILLEEFGRGGLGVLSSRAFDMLVPASLGDVTSRVLRGTPTSVLAIRDLDEAPAKRERRIAEVGKLRADAKAALERGELAAAEADLRHAAALLPGLAAIEDELAAVLEKDGRREEAERYRALARILRDARS